MLWVSLIVAIGCAFLGVYLSFFLDSAPAPTIVLVFAVLFMLTLGYHSAGRVASPGT
ncbi:hypothetical protein D3C76_1772870 [compost metagenome]